MKKSPSINSSPDPLDFLYTENITSSNTTSNSINNIFSQQNQQFLQILNDQTAIEDYSILQKPLAASYQQLNESWDDQAFQKYRSRECSQLLFDIFSPSPNPLQSSPAQFQTPAKNDNKQGMINSDQSCEGSAETASDGTNSKPPTIKKLFLKEFVDHIWNSPHIGSRD